MSVLSISIALNVYLLLGILLYAVNKNAASQSRNLYHKTMKLYALYTVCVIVLWPVSMVVRHIFIERLAPKYF